MKPNFEFLKKVFEKFAQKHSNDDLAARAIRSAASGVKTSADNFKQEFPKEFITGLVQDIYDTITSQDLSDGISSQVRSFDESQIEEIFSSLTSKLKDPQIAGQIAKSVKQVLEQNSPEQLTQILEQLLDQAKLDLGQKFVAQQMLKRLQPTLEDLKNSSEQEIARRIMYMADNIPSALIADTLADLTRNITPERVSKTAHNFVGKLPAPKTVTKVFHGVADSVSKHMDELSKITDSKQASAIIKAMGKSHRDIVAQASNDDQKAKNSFPKKGGKFKF